MVFGTLGWTHLHPRINVCLWFPLLWPIFSEWHRLSIRQTQSFEWDWQCDFSLCGFHPSFMDYIEAQEFRRILRRNEESINNNRTSLFSVTTIVHKNEHQCTSYNAMIMNTMVQHKKQIIFWRQNAPC